MCPLEGTCASLPDVAVPLLLAAAASHSNASVRPIPHAVGSGIRARRECRRPQAARPELDPAKGLPGSGPTACTFPFSSVTAGTPAEKDSFDIVVRSGM
jgi:hypothetical protein